MVYDLGQGVYRWADVILGGLDNREARVAINQAAARAGKVWIDGAIERLDGVARVFDPATGPCYECTMGENDWKMLEARRSCDLLSRGEMEQGKVPTTPTTAAIVAGIQAQEAVKFLHGLESSPARGLSSTAPTTRATWSATPARRTARPTRPMSPSRSSPAASPRPGSATSWSGSVPTWVPRRSSRPAATCWARSVATLPGGRTGLRLARPGHRGPGPMPGCGRPRTPLDVPHHRRPRPGDPRQDARRRSASPPGTSSAAVPAGSGDTMNFRGSRSTVLGNRWSPRS